MGKDEGNNPIASKEGSHMGQLLVFSCRQTVANQGETSMATTGEIGMKLPESNIFELEWATATGDIKTISIALDGDIFGYFRLGANGCSCVIIEPVVLGQIRSDELARLLRVLNEGCMNQHITPDWLKSKIESEPETEIEAGGRMELPKSDVFELIEAGDGYIDVRLGDRYICLLHRTIDGWASMFHYHITLKDIHHDELSRLLRVLNGEE